MLLPRGTRLGAYEITAPIGSGGMGDVYRAHDSRLGRDVAIKVSAEQFSERFEREARAIAALNHTNICHLYDVGPNYLVMEIVEGQTLAEPLPSTKRSPSSGNSSTGSRRRTTRESSTATSSQPTSRSRPTGL